MAVHDVWVECRAFASRVCTPDGMVLECHVSTQRAATARSSLDDVTGVPHLPGIMSRFEAGWRGESPGGMLLGDPLAVAAAVGLAAAAEAACAAEGAAEAAAEPGVAGHKRPQGMEADVEVAGSVAGAGCGRGVIGAAVKEEEEEAVAERGAARGQRQGEGEALGLLQQLGGIVTEVDEVECHVELHGEARDGGGKRGRSPSGQGSGAALWCVGRDQGAPYGGSFCDIMPVHSCSRRAIRLLHCTLLTAPT